MMKLCTFLVLALAAVVVSVEAFAPGFSLDHHLAQKSINPSELHYSSVVEPPDLQLPTKPNNFRTISLVQPNQILPERQFKPLASTEKPIAPPAPLRRSILLPKEKKVVASGSSPPSAATQQQKNASALKKQPGQILKLAATKKPTLPGRRSVRHPNKKSTDGASTPCVAQLIASQKQTLRPLQQQVAAADPRNSSSSSAKPRPGLSRSEELEYSFQIRTFRAAVRLRDQLVRHDAATNMHIHPTEAEWAAACGTSIMDLRRVMHAGQNARSALVAANGGLVTAIAKKHYFGLKAAVGGGIGTILTLQDMVQEGNLGLMEAAERYEPERGFRFSTYATWWVRQRILLSISETSRTIRLPAHVHSMIQKMRKAKNDIKCLLGREPTAVELARHLDVKEEKLQLYEDASRNVLSLERPLRSASFREDSRTLGDTLASDAPTPEEDAEADYLRRDIQAMMETALEDKEREVIVKRYGLDDGKPRTTQETAQLLDLTPDRVRLVEARALNKLRHPQRKYKLKEYIVGSGGIDQGRAADSDSDSGSASLFYTPEYRDYQRRQQEEQRANGNKSDRIWFF